jgi:translation elongation factor EF-Ts
MSVPPPWIAATISPALVKQLRDETGAGMMDCKNALSESEGDIIKAHKLLRKKARIFLLKSPHKLQQNR